MIARDLDKGTHSKPYAPRSQVCRAVVPGKEVKLVNAVSMGDTVSAVAITPDGKHALASKNAANKIVWLDIDGRKVNYRKIDFGVGVCFLSRTDYRGWPLRPCYERRERRCTRRWLRLGDRHRPLLSFVRNHTRTCSDSGDQVTP